MINILSLRCGLAFTPYLSASVEEFLAGGSVASRVVRQGGTGLILRSMDDLVIRHEGRQVSLGADDARHYAATIKKRQDFYDVLQMQSEIVVATVANEVLLSHPQSDIRLNRESIGALVAAFASQSDPKADVAFPGLPDWLTVSAGAESLLLSDQRTGRWVLLGDDHLRELERRSGTLRQNEMTAPVRVPPTIALKGLAVHLQSAFKLVWTLNRFASNESIDSYEELAPGFSLAVSTSAAGLELRDSDHQIELTAREARKWADIIKDELERLNAEEFERGSVRTIIARNEEGCWVLQWGDEIFVSGRSVLPRNSQSHDFGQGEALLIDEMIDEMSVLLHPDSGACVALTSSESLFLAESLLGT